MARRSAAIMGSRDCRSRHWPISTACNGGPCARRSSRRSHHRGKCRSGSRHGWSPSRRRSTRCGAATWTPRRSNSERREGFWRGWCRPRRSLRAISFTARSPPRAINARPMSEPRIRTRTRLDVAHRQSSPSRHTWSTTTTESPGLTRMGAGGAARPRLTLPQASSGSGPCPVPGVPSAS
jgi:hypothetical protein